MNAMCMVCHEPNKFRVQTDNVERIINYLKVFVDETQYVEIKNRQLWSTLSHDSQYVHIMCGMCPKINKTTLAVSEDRLKKIVYQICIQLENGTTLPHHNILQVLQGSYPLMWREIHKRCMHKS